MVTQPKIAIAQHQLLDRLAIARESSDALFNLVRDSSRYERPIPERHRIVFYIGHLEAFDRNLLHDRLFEAKSADSELDHLFAFGIDPVDGGLPSDKPSDWPALDQVQSYVARTRAILDAQLLFTTDSSGRQEGELSPFTLLNVAIEHRRMHIETLAYMLHQLPLQNKIRPLKPSPILTQPVSQRMIEIPAGKTIVGLSRGDNAFGWDNEYERHERTVPAFEIDQHMVTNGQYLEFLSSGGYETRSLWSDADWQWLKQADISHPVFWKITSDGWMYRSMFDEIRLPLDWPVYVSHAEASAYARWAGKSLPTEEEWQRAVYGDSDEPYPWGGEPPNPHLGNFDLYRWDPAPVNACSAGRSSFGLVSALGNGWEWTATEFAPFDGFQPFSFYPGYSANFFDGKHFVMKGGSARTAACMLRPSFRNWFQAHYQYVYAGFRCVRR